MSVTVKIPTPLRRVTDGVDEIEASSDRLDGALAVLNERFPRHQGATLQRRRRVASLRQHLREWRGCPIPQRP